MKTMMKRILSVMLTLPLLVGCSAAPEGTEPQEAANGSKMRHMSFNVFGTEGYPGFENEEKRNSIKTIISEIDPDTFGVQEAAQAWTDGLAGLLDNRYAMVAGHSDPKVEKPANWTNAIYYKADKFNCLDSGLYYLNGDGAYNVTDNCGFALLERNEDGALILLLNVHLHWLPLGGEELRTFNRDNFGENTADTHYLRMNQAVWAGQLAQEKVKSYSEQYGKPVAVLLSGDFNINALHPEPYIQDYNSVTINLKKMGLVESAKTAGELVTNQDTDRWVTYRRGTKENRLDYIFISETVQPQTFTVHKLEQAWEVSSDHMPVYLDYYIKK